MLLGTPNGTVDLRTGLVREGRPEDNITKVCAVSPASSTDCPRFIRFMDEVTGGDLELIRFLQQYCGYALTGLTREHALAFIHGGGGEGKTTFVNAISARWATSAVTAAMDTFISRLRRSPHHRCRDAARRSAGHRVGNRTWAHLGRGTDQGDDRRDPITARFMHKNISPSPRSLSC